MSAQNSLNFNEAVVVLAQNLAYSEALYKLALKNLSQDEQNIDRALRDIRSIEITISLLEGPVPHLEKQLEDAKAAHAAILKEIENRPFYM